MKMCKTILRCKRRPAEEWVDFQQRTSDRIRAIWCMSSIQPWDQACLQRIHSWAGHIARYDSYDPCRWPAVLTRYRDSQYIVQTKAVSSDGRHLYRGHSRPVWRWEHNIYKYYNGDLSHFGSPLWRRKAMKEEIWAKSSPKWVAWRLARSAMTQGT